MRNTVNWRWIGGVGGEDAENLGSAAKKIALRGKFGTLRDFGKAAKGTPPGVPKQESEFGKTGSLRMRAGSADFGKETERRRNQWASVDQSSLRGSWLKLGAGCHPVRRISRECCVFVTNHGLAYGRGSGPSWALWCELQPLQHLLRLRILLRSSRIFRATARSFPPG
ncbi:MAG: hypothetical protein KatS3mg105_3004 [Gemmatales bacterium]|nr:MAG: hypothetical protein KatS3mg105_3004 [Gemmatales bacterium]